MAKIIIERRSSDGWGCMRRVLIEVDGKRCAKVWCNSRVGFAVGPGTHTIQARMAWVESSPIKATINLNDVIGFTCEVSQFRISLKEAFRKNEPEDSNADGERVGTPDCASEELIGAKGRGTLYAPDGSVRQTGQFKDGKCVEGSENSTPDTGEKVTSHGGTFHVPVTINGVITLNFTIDSGASDVTIPADVVSTLIRTGSLVGSDFIGERKYVLADGSLVPAATFNIRSLKVGDRVLQNVLGSEASAKGSLLLGQSFLSRFNSWSIDNKRQMLILN